MPKVTADWQWSGVWPVTTEAVLTGAWEIPREKALALIFVNVSPKPVSASFRFDAAAYGLPGKAFRLTRVTPNGPGKTETTPAAFTRTLTFQAGEACAWMVTAATD